MFLKLSSYLRTAFHCYPRDGIPPPGAGGGCVGAGEGGKASKEVDNGEEAEEKSRPAAPTWSEGRVQLLSGSLTDLKVVWKSDYLQPPNMEVKYSHLEIHSPVFAGLSHPLPG